LSGRLQSALCSPQGSERFHLTEEVPGERKQKLTIPARWEGRLRFVCELRPRCDTAQSMAWRPSRREDFHSQELAIRLKNSPDEIPPDLLTLARPFPEGYAPRRKALQLFRSEAASWRTIICRTATNGVVGKSESRASRFLIDIAKLRPRFREAGGFGANGLRSTSAYLSLRRSTTAPICAGDQKSVRGTDCQKIATRFVFGRLRRSDAVGDSQTDFVGEADADRTRVGWYSPLFGQVR
jgi:hypothetical protein